VALALHFLNGNNKGKEFPVPDGGGLLLCRTTDDDVEINPHESDLRYAMVSGWGERVSIRSLNPNDLLLVNQVQVAQAELKEGDRVKVGRILVLVVAVTRFSISASKPSGETEVSFVTKARTRGHVDGGMGLSGSIADTAVSDLLQFLCRYGRTGTLRIENMPIAGRVHLRDGHVCYATIDESLLTPLRALFRIFRWKKGTFVFEQCAVPRFPDEIDISGDTAILEGLRLMDELQPLEAELPAWDQKLKLSGSLNGVQAGLPADEMQALLLVMELGTVGRVIDQMPDDLIAVSSLAALLRRKFVVLDV